MRTECEINYYESYINFRINYFIVTSFVIIFNKYGYIGIFNFNFRFKMAYFLFLA